MNCFRKLVENVKLKILNPVIQPTHCMHAHLVLNLIIIKRIIRSDLTHLIVLS